jgi:hypothetical protein
MSEAAGSTGDFAGRRCLRLLAREAWWQGWRESAAVALLLETDDGRWHEFRLEVATRRWYHELLATPPRGRVLGDDAEERHPLHDVGAEFATDGKRLLRIDARTRGDLAELVIEFDDGAALLAHHRDPGGSSLTYTLPH